MKNKTLKSGWRWVRFGDVVRLPKTKSKDPLADGFERYVGLEHLEPGDLRIRSYGNVADGVTFTSVFQPGQVLFGKRRAYQRKVAVADFTGVCSGDIYVLETKDPQILLPELLPFICQTEEFFEHAVGTSAGSLSPRTNWTSLSSFEFALPPKNEQSRLVTLLNTIEECLSSLSEAEIATRTLELAKLDIAFASIPNSRLVSVSDLIHMGPKNGFSPKTNAEKRGYPTLSIGAVRDGQIVVDGNVKYADISEKDALNFRLKTNDVLVVRGNGNKYLTGKCGIVDAIPDGCFYPDLLIKLEFKQSLIRPEFAVLQWNNPGAHNILLTRAKTTNGIWKINGADIRKHMLKVPDLSKQDALLGEVREIQLAIKDINIRKEKLEHLKSYALKEMSHGGIDDI
ncbi:MAG: restriction endonuclease subunit S [Rouxiella badensis]|uniref:restriction endonuclease subunit S n=1 Tax=Rouxiella badensis TaxID=1646377 RepID=UPI003C45810F